MKEICLSIITVSYNAAKTIEQTIQSVVKQTYDNIEYIIIDGGSTDGTVDIIRKYEDKIAYWISEADKGIYDAMNKGILKASGEYIYFLGADDCLVDDKVITKIICELQDDIDIISAGIYLVDEDLALQRYMDGRFASIKEKYSGQMIPHQGVFVKTKIMKNNMFSLNYRIASDFDFFLKCYFDDNVDFKYLDFPVAFYSNGGRSSREVFGNKEHVELMKKYSLSPELINRYNRKYNNKWILFLKKFFREIGITRYILLACGAKKHSCFWYKCRWCHIREKD